MTKPTPLYYTHIIYYNMNYTTSNIDYNQWYTNTNECIKNKREI